MARANGSNQELMARMGGSASSQTSNKPATINGMLSDVNVKKRFEEILGKKAAGFMSSIINVTKSNSMLQVADPKTIIAAAAIAASLDLPIDPNLGFAYIVPYNNSKKINGEWIKVSEAQFQLGYKGFIQLAMRTGQYKTINACEVYEGEIKSINRFTGEMEFGEKQSDVVIGYLAYFKLLNGFEKYFYMAKEEIEKHAARYSQSYAADLKKDPGKKKTSRWAEDFDKMALKTVLKILLSKYGILSIEMQTGLQADQAVINEDEQGSTTFEYSDNTIDVEGSIVEEHQEIPDSFLSKTEEDELDKILNAGSGGL